MLHALRRLGVPQKYLRIIESLYSDVKFFVEDRFSRSTTESQEAGLRQGDGLSCWLFIALLTVVSHHLSPCRTSHSTGGPYLRIVVRTAVAPIEVST